MASPRSPVAAPVLNLLEESYGELEGLSRSDVFKRHAAALQKKSAKIIDATVPQAARGTLEKTSGLVSDRGAQVAFASAVGGATVFGAGGAGAGLLVGGTLGAAFGLLPALVTFGMSIPLGAVMGAGWGIAIGGAVGQSVGFTGAGAVGYTAYVKRVEISNFAAVVQAKLEAAYSKSRAKLASYASSVKTMAANTYAGAWSIAINALESSKASIAETQAAVKRRARELAAATKQRARELAATAKQKAINFRHTAKKSTIEFVSDKNVQATAASAAGGAVVMGTGGAAAGLATGSAIGAAVGLVPAIFTFGLSIPFCSFIGGGCGLAAGTAVGGATGAVAGAGGYRAYKNREAIRGFAGDMSSKARESAKNTHARLNGVTGGTSD